MDGEKSPYAFVKFLNIDTLAANETLRNYSDPKVHLAITHNSIEPFKLLNAEL